VPATSPPRKLALVTGASGGLGLEFARLLAADGCDLVLVARSEAKLEAIAGELSAAHGVAVEPVALDLARSGAAQTLLARVPRCDVLINNAGFAGHGRFDTLDPVQIEEEIGLDVAALTLLTRAYLPGMVSRGSGKILNVASTAGFLPGPFMAVYYASKSYVISFSQAIAEELRGTGVTVTCFCPGATETGFADRAGLRQTLLFRLPRSSAVQMASAGYRAMQRGTMVFVPWPPSNWFVEWSARLTPRRALLWFSRKAVETK
jgi:short-subunit dehydrogenase